MIQVYVFVKSENNPKIRNLANLSIVLPTHSSANTQPSTLKFSAKVWLLKVLSKSGLLMASCAGLQPCHLLTLLVLASSKFWRKHHSYDILFCLGVDPVILTKRDFLSLSIPP